MSRPSLKKSPSSPFGLGSRNWKLPVRL